MRASCIVVFANGSVKEVAETDGPESAHEKLMANRGEYYALFTGQEAKTKSQKQELKVKKFADKFLEILERTKSDGITSNL